MLILALQVASCLIAELASAQSSAAVVGHCLRLVLKTQGSAVRPVAVGQLQ
jgi:hypothetical protein